MPKESEGQTKAAHPGSAAAIFANLPDVGAAADADAKGKAAPVTAAAKEGEAPAPASDATPESAEGETPSDEASELEEVDLSQLTDAAESDLSEVEADLEELTHKALEGDKAAVQRLAERGKGLDKLKKQIETTRAELKEVGEKAKVLDLYEQQLSKPETAPKVFNMLLEHYSQALGIPKRELLREVLPGISQEPQLLSELDEFGNKRTMAERHQMTEGEYKLFLRTQDLEQRLARNEAGNKAAIESQAHAAQRAETNKYVEKVAPMVNAILTKEGFPVTVAMVGKALAALPQLKDTPAAAVRAFYAKEYAQARVKAASAGPPAKQKAQGRGHEALPSSSARGEERENFGLNPSKMKASDALARAIERAGS